MATLFKNHFSDECLISHLDGELPFYRRVPVNRHLAQCWQCRLRLKEIEKQVLELTQAMREDTFPGSQRLVEARLKFLREAEEIAEEAPPAKPATWKLAWAAAACVALPLGLWWATRAPGRQPDPSPASAIRLVEMAEGRAGAGHARKPAGTLVGAGPRSIRFATERCRRPLAARDMAARAGA